MKRILLYIYILLSGFGLNASAQSQNHNFSTAQALDIFNGLYRDLDLYYVDTLDAEFLIETAIDAMLNELDPYTEFYKEQDTNELRTLTTGKYAGIGSPIFWRKDCDRCVFNAPYEHMPASKAGVRTGDIIMKIDGKDVGKCGNKRPSDYTSDISARLRGEAGTILRLAVKRPGHSGLIEMEIRRENIKRPSVAYTTVLDTVRTQGTKLGYILLESFTEETGNDFSLAFKNLKSKGVSGLVLDLRGNGGGVMQQAVEVVSNFLPRGSKIVETKGREESENKVLKTMTLPVDAEIPLVVLVDYGTASASEITSGALQDYDRAVIVGQRTYGKGLVQSPRRLPYNTMMKFTSSKYYIPSGRCVQARDFKHRGADGQPLHLPDSLCRTFHTQAGRPVKDGGGITPDIVTHLDSLPTMLTYLELSDEFFDYCVNYRNTHEAIAPPEEFHLTDAEFEEFKAYMGESGFTYDNRTKTALDYVRSLARQEGYADEAKAEFEALETKLVRNLCDDLQHWQKEVRSSLETAIIGAYYYDHGMVTYALKDDPTLDEAVRILCHPEEYQRILSGK